MKILKYLCFGVVVLLAPKISQAVTSPLSLPLGDQVYISLVDHVTPVTEFLSNGTTKVEFLDGLVQFGHYKGDYIFALDGGFANNSTRDASGHISTTWGAHMHIVSLIKNYLGANVPAFFDVIDATPRYSYDTDVHHGVFGYMVGATFSFQ